MKQEIEITKLCDRCGDVISQETVKIRKKKDLRSVAAKATPDDKRILCKPCAVAVVADGKSPAPVKGWDRKPWG